MSGILLLIVVVICVVLFWMLVREKSEARKSNEIATETVTQNHMQMRAFQQSLDVQHKHLRLEHENAKVLEEILDIVRGLEDENVENKTDESIEEVDEGDSIDGEIKRD